jgi:hypothetical protein
MAMNIERRGDFLHTRLGSGGVEWICYLDNASDDEPLQNAIAAWDGDESVSISTNFKLMDSLQQQIDSHRTYKNAIVADSKPFFDAMRKELVEMVELIDSLEFLAVVVESPNNQHLSLSDLKEIWNAQADENNQWDTLGHDEIVAFVQTVHGITKDATA